MVETSLNLYASSEEDAFFGCIFGALIGDASGTFLEFSS